MTSRRSHVRDECLHERPYRLYTVGTTNYCTTYILDQPVICTDCRAGGERPPALTACRFNGSSKLAVQKLHHRHEGYYVRSDVVFRPRKYCGPASARAVPVLVNAMLTIHHLIPIMARCCLVYGQPQTSQATKQPACYPARPVTLWCCIGTSS